LRGDSLQLWRGWALAKERFIAAPRGNYELVEQHAGFNAESFRRNFAPYLFTYLRGFREAATLLLLDTRFDDCLEKVHAYVRAERFSAPKVTPEKWKQALGPNANWETCHGNQIDRICLGAAARVDRNLQATLALSVLFGTSENAALRTIDVYEFITLAPAIYSLRNLTDAARNWLQGKNNRAKEEERFEKFIRELCTSDNTSQRHARARLFLEDASLGCGMTWQNAKRIETVLRSRLDWTGVEVRILTNRMEGRRPQKRGNEPRMGCCRHEAEFVLLDARKLKKLQSIKGVASESAISDKNDTRVALPPRGTAHTVQERKA
jgi:hypothetical protein